MIEPKNETFWSKSADTCIIRAMTATQSDS